MAGVTDQGFEQNTLEDIVDGIDANAKTEFGETFPTTPDSPYGVHTRVLGAAILDAWLGTEEVANQQNRDTATGVYLESLAALIGLQRLEATGSVGPLVFTGTVGGTVPAFFPVEDDSQRIVLSQAEVVYNRAECYESTFSVNTVSNNTFYTIIVNGDTYTIESSGAATEDEILTSLETAIGDRPLYHTVSRPSDTQIRVQYKNRINVLATTNSNNLTLDTVGYVVVGQAVTTGALEFPADTLINLGAPSLFTESVTNPNTLTLGRDEESDEDLRQRMSEREQSTGTATKPAIESALSEVQGVTSVLLIENQDIVPDVDSRPAKSFESYVVGGDDQEIADVIWETKPAGIYPHGTTVQTIIDQNDDIQTVRFSRPANVYAHMRITYVLNNEEMFPASGVTLMKEVVVEAGSAMYRGEDFEPTKFYGPLYDGVQGAYYTLIEITTTPNPSDIPNPADFQTTTIPVSVTEVLVFDESRVTVTT